jgi:hypothetical protein
MRRNAVLALALAAILGAGGIVAAEATWNSASAQELQQAFTDEQVRAYFEANREIAPISTRVAQMTPPERAQATSRIRTILQRHGLSADQYNAIDTQARTDAALSERIAALHVQNLTDDLLRRFVAAAAEIDPISRSLTAEATAEDRAHAAAQIRAALDRHRVSAAAYNAIAAQAQSDEALAARIAALQTPGASAPDVGSAQ